MSFSKRMRRVSEAPKLQAGTMMLSIDRVRTTTLSLLGLRSGIASDILQRASDRTRDADAGEESAPADDACFGAPVIEAVEAALKEAGYLHS